MKNKKCILCNYNAQVKSVDPLNKNFQFICPNCGTYYVDRAFRDYDKSEVPLHLLSGFSLEQSKYEGMTKKAITLGGYKDILKTNYIPRTREEQLDQLMLYYYREIGNNLKHTVKISLYPAICYARDAKELKALFYEAIDKEYLDYVNNRNEYVQVTYKGAEFCEDVKAKRSKEKLKLGNKDTVSFDQQDIWAMIHTELSNTVKKLMLDGYYDSAITASVKLLENYVKNIYKKKSGIEMSGTPLMQKVFNPNNPFLKFEDISSQSGKDLQDGYRNIFVGVQLGIRNPYSHDTDREPSKYEAFHIIVMISHLMNMVDKSVKYTDSIE